MKTICKSIVLGVTFACSTFTLGNSVAKADDYWNNHWGWYDNSYRPYYQRNYYRNPNYGGGYRYYGPSQYYGPSYYGNGYYYGRPYYGNGVQVGPLRFGWW